MTPHEQPPLLYLDNNATTPLAPQALEAMLPYFSTTYGNASSPHPAGRPAAKAVAHARTQLARLFGAASPEEVLFTAGGTESLHTAIRAAAPRLVERPRLITTAVEHPAVLSPMERLAERVGGELVVLPVDRDGQLDADAAVEAIDERTALFSLLWANNETGVICRPEILQRIAERTRATQTWLHLDAVQTAGKLPLRLSESLVDMASVSGHKFHGPKGSGALWVRAGLELDPLFVGGSQQEGRRAGTLDVPSIVGLGRAAELAAEFAEDAGRVAELTARRDGFEAELQRRLSGAVVHGQGSPRTANTCSVALPGLSADALMMLLGEFGVCVSTGAACSTGKRKASHVLLGMGLELELARSTLRLSLSRETPDADLAAALDALVQATEQLQALAI